MQAPTPLQNNKLWQRGLVWALISVMANPFAMLSLYSSPALARDTDIYLSTVNAGSTAEPAILLIIDTSESMNIPEAWREYPGAYDSHVEYLWNDINIISSTEQTTASLAKITDAAAPVLTPYGSWAGATLAERQALWTSAKNYANATEPGDPDARSIYRNYNDANWIYWLPAGTDESDTRLWSISFNRWAGGVKQSGWPAQSRGGIDFGGTLDSRKFNLCNDSLAKLLPSTVFAPTNYPSNTGKYLNQQWQRWERFLDLRNGRASNGDTTYPTSLGTIQIPSAGTVQILTGSAIGNVGSNIRARSEFLGAAGGVSPFPVRDSYPRGPSFGSNLDIGDQGQPIRTRIDGGTAGVVDTGDSRSGWTDMKADLGGFNFQSAVNGMNTTQLVNVLDKYGISATITTATHLAWKGNRDNATAPAFGKMTGTPAYYDANGAVLKLQDAAAITTTLCTRTCVIDADPGTAGNQSVFLAANSGNPPKDGDNSTTYKYWVKNGATCQSTGISGTDCSTPPAACGTIQNQTNAYKTINATGCQWSGRSSFPVEGTGTYYYGGTCSGSCRGEGGLLGASACPSLSTSTSYCNETASDVTIGSTVYANATLNSGGNGSATNCSDIADTTVDCQTHEGSAGCRYVNSTDTCADPTVTSTTTVGSADYTVYPYAASDTYLNHDCKADNATSGNPSSGYMTTATNRTFNTAWVGTTSSTGTTAPYTSTDPGATYPPVDMYSVNYLNWKYGPKGPNGNPIGRMTRLQTAKDALSALVANTDGVRFGLMVYNKLPSLASGVQGTQGSQGGNVAYAVRRMGSNSADSAYANRATLIAAINNITASGTTPLTEVTYEAYLYFRGETPQFGTLTTAPTSGTYVSDGRDPAAICPSGKSYCTAGNYISPMMLNPDTDPETAPNEPPASCQKNYVVLVSDGGPENDNQADTQVRALKQGPPYLSDWITTEQSTTTKQLEVTSGVPYGPTDIAYSTNYVWLDELTYFMEHGDMSPRGASATDSIAGPQSVITYTIGFAGGSSAVLQEAAHEHERGGGAYYQADNSSALSAALASAIASIRDWNPTIAAPTVPISAFNRSENSDDVYMAFFGPKLQTGWDGTVKKYKISTNTSVCGNDLDNHPIPLCLTGQTAFSGSLKNIEQFALDPDTGERTAAVRNNAVSYWSDTADPDGGHPDKGGSCHVLLSASGSTPAARHAYTHITGESEVNLTAAVNAMSEANSSITKTMLGNASMTDATRSTILNFARGGDPSNTNCNDANIGTSCTAWRTWPHSDVLHSRPIVLTYDPDPDGNPATNDMVQYMFYMSNDGWMHAVDTTTGQEKWAFMPEEALTQQYALMINAVGEHIHAGDGSPMIYVEDVDHDGKITAADKAYLIFGQRRGGRAMYALDISSKDAPHFMWKVSNATADMSELGETWSTPGIAKMKASTDPVLVFGAGYDPKPNDMIGVTISHSGSTATVTTPVDHLYSTGNSITVSGATGANKDTYNGNHTITTTGPRSFTFNAGVAPTGGSYKVVSHEEATMGRGVFFVNARTGALIKSFTPGASSAKNSQVSDMLYSIPSDAMTLNTDLDSSGYADRLYLGDLGGNIWRFDIDDADPTHWGAIKFADLTGSDTPRRKIFFPPAVVKQEYLGQRYDGVYIGTGDRENPLRVDNVDKLFMIEDSETGLASKQSAPITYGTSYFYDITANLIQVGSAADKTAAATALQNAAGWSLSLAVGALAGEKAVNAPTVFSNVLRFGTYSPLAAASACTPPGKGNLYAISALDGSIVADTNHDGKVDPATDARTFSDYTIRGFPSSGTVVIRDNKVWILTTSDGVTKAENIGPAGIGQRIYWSQEPEK